MSVVDLPALIGGPYTAPPHEAGASIRDQLAGRRVTVAGTTDAPIPWPYLAGPGGKRRPILTGDLAEAVRVESAEAVAAHWGVSRWTVRDWRRALGVGRTTAGTRARTAALAPAKLPTEARRRGGRASAGRGQPRTLHLAAAGPGEPLAPARPRDRAPLTRLGWSGPVEPGDVPRLVRAALAAGVTLVIRRE